MAADPHRAGLDGEVSFRALAELLPQLVWVTNEIGRLTFANARFLDYFGITDDAFASWWLKDWLHPDDVTRATTTWKRALQNGEPYEVEYRLRAVDGSHHWFLARGMPFHGIDDRIAGWCGTSTPIDRQAAVIERQTRIVEAFQTAFIPRPIPTIAGMTIDGAYIPADEESRVGGDFYDVLALERDETILVAMGDVTGHGLAAALSMTKLRQAIVGAAVESVDPAVILARAQRVFALLDDAVATAVVVAVEPRRRRLRYALAGHPPPLIASPAGSAFLAPGGIPLNVDPAQPFETRERPLRADEMLILYTDGLIEARRTVEADEALLLEAAQRSALRGILDAAALHAAVIGSTRTTDDVAVLALRIDP